MELLQTSMRNGVKEMIEKKTRPQKYTQKLELNCPMKIPILDTDTVEYATVDSRGYTIFRSRKKEGKATVIKGHKEGKEITVTPDDSVYSCKFSKQGHLSALPEDEGTEVTIITH